MLRCPSARRSFFLVAALAGCQFDPWGLESGSRPDAEKLPIDGTPPPDTPERADASPPTGPFSAPVPVAELNSAWGDDDPTLTADMLEIYFNSNRDTGNGDIFRSTRDTLADAWSPPERVVELSSSVEETTPEVALDGLTIFLSSTRGGGDFDIYVSRRASRLATWSAPARVPELCSTSTDSAATPSLDLLYLVLSSARPGDVDLFASSRASVSAPWSTPAPLDDVNTVYVEADSWFDPGRFLLYFASDRGIVSGWDLYVATRTSTLEPFGAAQPVAELNSYANDSDLWLSPDLRTVYFASDRAGTWDLYVATR